MGDLKRLQADPSQGQEVKGVLDDFIREDQARAVIAQLVEQLQGADHRCVFQTNREVYSLAIPNPVIAINNQTLTITGGAIEFRQESDGQVRTTAAGPRCVVTIKPDPENDQAFVSLDMPGAQVDSGNTATNNDFSRRFALPLPRKSRLLRPAR